VTGPEQPAARPEPTTAPEPAAELEPTTAPEQPAQAVPGQPAGAPLPPVESAGQTPAPPQPAPPVDTEWKRLHPLTPLVRGAKVFGGIAAIGIYQAYQTIQEVGILPLLVGVLVVVIGAFVVSWISWRFTGYRVTNRELHIQEGILARRHRTVPLERVQAIDVVRPVLARLLGLAEVRLEVVGQGNTEAPLAYLSNSEALQTRALLLALVSGANRPTDTPEATSSIPAGALSATVPDERPLFRVDPRALILSQLLTPNTLSLPLLAIFPVVSLAFDGLSWPSLFGAASAIIGIAQLPVRRVLNEYGFAVSDTSQGLRLRHGLLETRTQTVAPGRVQAVRIRRPLLWRPFGWVRVEIAVAGYSAAGQQEQRTGALVPVADEATAFALLRTVFPQLPPDLSTLEMTPVPARARWLTPLQYRRLAATTTRELFITRSGWLTEHNDIAVLARAQSIRFVQGPVQRRLRLGSVYADLAGDHGTTAVHELDAGDALRLVTDLVDRSRATRPTP
jgi:putative membrane protein